MRYARRRFAHENPKSTFACCLKKRKSKDTSCGICAMIPVLLNEYKEKLVVVLLITRVWFEAVCGSTRITSWLRSDMSESYNASNIVR